MPETHPQSAIGDQKDAMVAGYEAAAQRIELEIGFPKGRVLDIGCNTGAGMDILQARWRHLIFGIEPVGLFAQAARDKGLKVLTASVEQSPFCDEAFALVFSRHSLEHVADRPAAIAEMHRVLKKGGHIYVQVPLEPAGSPNELHLSPFKDHYEMREAFGLCDIENCALCEGHKLWREIYWGVQETVVEFIGQKI